VVVKLEAAYTSVSIPYVLSLNYGGVMFELYGQTMRNYLLIIFNFAIRNKFNNFQLYKDSCKRDLLESFYDRIIFCYSACKVSVFRS